jgi:hypothetical protein
VLIEQRASEMERMKNDYRKKALYLSAQMELEQQQSRLAQTGKGWQWLDWLVLANFNRPDLSLRSLGIFRADLAVADPASH